ncbi:MAG TPA: TetR/AcrR family transcriptional regulator [Candidatus Dormibacteraeota bacterium]
MEASLSRRLSRDERRRQLVELGLELLSSSPRELVAIDRISEMAGISRGLLFHYFPTKRDYHVAVIEAACARLLERTEPDPSLEPAQRLRGSLDAYVDFVRQNQPLYRSLIRGAAGADADLEALVERTRGVIASRVFDYLGLTVAAPPLRAAVRGWIGFVEESTLDWLRHEDLSRSELIELQSRAFESALASAGAAT